MPLSLVELYLQQHPEKVALCLLEQDPEAVTEFINSLNTHNLQLLLNHISYTIYDDIFVNLKKDKQVFILAQLPSQQAHMLLLTLPTNLQELLLQEMSSSFQSLHRHYEKIKQSMIGQLMVTQFFSINEDLSIKEVKERMKLATNSSDIFFVVDRQHRYLGYIKMSVLMAQKSAATLSYLLIPSPHIIHITQSLSAVIDNQGWQTQQCLPVLDGSKHIIGIININDIYQYLTSSANQQEGSLLPIMMSSFVEMISDLVGSMLSGKPVRKSRQHD